MLRRWVSRARPQRFPLRPPRLILRIVSGQRRGLAGLRRATIRRIRRVNKRRHKKSPCLKLPFCERAGSVRRRKPCLERQEASAFPAAIQSRLVLRARPALFHPSCVHFSADCLSARGDKVPGRLCNACSHFQPRRRLHVRPSTGRENLPRLASAVISHPPAVRATEVGLPVDSLGDLLEDTKLHC